MNWREEGEREGEGVGVGKTVQDRTREEAAKKGSSEEALAPWSP